MTCDAIERDEIAERYLLGRLSDDEQEQFEAHYFDCARCLDRLRTIEAARDVLAVETTLPKDLPLVVGARPASARSRRWWQAAAALAAAAVIVLSVRVLQQTAPSGPPPERSSATTPAGDIGGGEPLPQRPAQEEPQWARLGAFNPPEYSPLRLRSSATEAHREFRSAMALYTEKNYLDAASRLRRVVALPAAPVDARFYLAVCELQTGRLQEAAFAFERVIGFGESPYLEDAHFLLAKTRIRQRDIAAARSQLLRVAALDGDRLEEARLLMSQLPR